MISDISSRTVMLTSDALLEDFAVLIKIISTILSEMLLHKFEVCWLVDKELSISPALLVNGTRVSSEVKLLLFDCF